MGLLSRLFGAAKGPVAPLAGVWPNHETWVALKEGVVATEDGPWFFWTQVCGELELPSGRLAVCDPFVFLSKTRTPFVVAPKGRFPVVVTLVDVSEKQDRSHVREAYASIIFSGEKDAYRKAMPLALDGEERPETTGEDFVGFPVDAGTACFVDETVIGPCMPDEKTWLEELFENEKQDCWFNRMDDPKHIREGLANIQLPLGKRGENLILFHSGWGDGVYPVVGSFDLAGRLLAAHVDFLVVK